MFEHKFITNAISRSAENALDRRRFFQAAGVAGFGVGSAVLLAGQPALATERKDDGGAPSDSAILNFALNLEYLEAEFYLQAVTGNGLPDDMITGRGQQGDVSGGYAVPFDTPAIRKYAQEIAADEKSHVAFLRSALGGAAVSRPTLNLDDSFTAAALAAGLIGPGETFDVFENEVNFLFGAFIFEDVGVSAYKGASPLITNKTYLEAAAGILAAEAYHAGLVRTVLYAKGLATPSLVTAAGKISDARDSLDGASDDDQGIAGPDASQSNIVPTDANGLAYSRTTGQVLNIVYLSKSALVGGGFFPNGINGNIRTSAAN